MLLIQLSSAQYHLSNNSLNNTFNEFSFNKITSSYKYRNLKSKPISNAPLAPDRINLFSPLASEINFLLVFPNILTPFLREKTPSNVIVSPACDVPKCCQVSPVV